MFITHIFIAVPMAPGIPTYTNYTRNEIAVAWPKPIDNGGLPVMNYTCQMSGNQVVWATIFTNTTEWVATGLEYDTVYYFRVIAANALGQSHYSPVANLTTAARLCGDGICDIGWENCTTCYLDCGSCGTI